MADLGKNTLDSLKGNTGLIEKAIIEVIDLGQRKVEKKGSLKVVGGTKGSAANKSVGDALVNQDMLAAQMIEETGKNAVSDAYVKVLAKKIANSSRRYFTVQFNPSSLQLSGHAGGLVQRLSYDKEDRDHDHQRDASASYTRGTTTIIMSVSLLFDSCDPQDAFLDDKLTLNATSVGKGVAKGVMSAMGQKKTSIQTEVEGFIAALRNSRTRLMTFNWGNFCYTGVLRSVGANYTMFNPNGEPVRATVDLSMVCADDEQWPNSLSVWQQRYINAFKKSGSESFVKTEQKVGSLVNL
ncbi:MAG: hypothetical protein K5847_06250 [Lachnospiraceae bacterium]|nr:hypothetical protein [Lachnospiraceae bacterium]